MRKGILVITCFLSVFLTQPAYAKTGGWVSVSGQSSLLNLPYPSLVSAGLAVTFFDFARIHAEVAGLESLMIVLDVPQYTIGGGLQLRIPFLPISPVLGISRSRSYSSNGQIWGSYRFRQFDHFISPEAAVEIRLGDSAYVGLGLFMPLKYDRNQGRWVNDKVDIENTLDGSRFNLGVFPYAYVGLAFL